VTLLDAQSSFFVSGSPHWKGNHGGGDWESQHLPLLIAGAGANPGFVSTSPARLEDIAPTVLTMMGVNPKGMQGTVLSDAMLSPNAADMAAQVSLNDKLLPVVDALASQDQTETRSAGGR
jgi:arylsulfatase A-like enzyme